MEPSNGSWLQSPELSTAGSLGTLWNEETTPGMNVGSSTQTLAGVTAPTGNASTSLYPLRFCNIGCSWTVVFALSTIICAIAVVVNAFVIAIIRRTPEIRQQPYSVLMINLCVSNILTSIVRGTLSNCGMQVLVSYSLSGCHIGEVTYSVTTFVSLITIAAMSFDRFLGITYHMRYESAVTTTKYLIFVAVQWLVCVGIGILPVTKKDVIWCVRRFGGCGYGNGGYIIWVQTVAVYIPSALVIIFAYARIWIAIRRLTRTASTVTKERARGVRTTAIILSAFVVTYLPRLIVALAMYTATGGRPRLDDFGLGIEDATSLFLGCNALVSPIIYSLTNRAFKKRLSTKSDRRRFSVSSVSFSRDTQSSTITTSPRSNSTVDPDIPDLPSPS